MCIDTSLRPSLMVSVALSALTFASLALARVPSASYEVNVKEHGAVGNGFHDDTFAISSIINSRAPRDLAELKVFFPPGRYLLNRPIELRSNVRLSGSGATSIIIQRVGLSAFRADGTASSPIKNITIENLSFLGAGGFQNSYGLSVNCGRHIIFRNNFANAIPLINIACGATSDESLMSSEVFITGNRAIGIMGEGAAILLQYVSKVTVTNNHIAKYDHGIQFWGGNIEAGEDYLGVKRATISANTVRHVGGAAVWGTEGEHISIIKNVVQDCGDVCLDAEASSDVKIAENSVQDARNGGIALFYGSVGIVISHNRVFQKAIYQQVGFNPSSSYAAIHIHGGSEVANSVSRKVIISGNLLWVSGISSAITTDQGALEESSIQSNSIISASFEAIPIRILEGKNISILANKVSSASARGISIEGTNNSSVMNNSVFNTVIHRELDLSAGGIKVSWRSAENPAQFNRISNNVVRGFPISINDDCWGDSSSFNLIDDNFVDAIIHRSAGESYGGVIRNNRSNSDSSIIVAGRAY